MSSTIGNTVSTKTAKTGPAPSAVKAAAPSAVKAAAPSAVKADAKVSETSKNTAPITPEITLIDLLSDSQASQVSFVTTGGSDNESERRTDESIREFFSSAPAPVTGLKRSYVEVATHQESVKKAKEAAKKASEAAKAAEIAARKALEEAENERIITERKAEKAKRKAEQEAAKAAEVAAKRKALEEAENERIIAERKAEKAKRKAEQKAAKAAEVTARKALEEAENARLVAERKAAKAARDAADKSNLALQRLKKKIKNAKSDRGRKRKANSPGSSYLGNFENPWSYKKSRACDAFFNACGIPDNQEHYIGILREFSNEYDRKRANRRSSKRSRFAARDFISGGVRGAEESSADEAEESSADEAEESEADEAEESEAVEAEESSADEAEESSADEAEESSAVEAEESEAVEAEESSADEAEEAVEAVDVIQPPVESVPVPGKRSRYNVCSVESYIEKMVEKGYIDPISELDMYSGYLLNKTNPGIQNEDFFEAVKNLKALMDTIALSHCGKQIRLGIFLKHFFSGRYLSINKISEIFGKTLDLSKQDDPEGKITGWLLVMFTHCEWLAKTFISLFQKVKEMILTKKDSVVVQNKTKSMLLVTTSRRCDVLDVAKYTMGFLMAIIRQTGQNLENLARTFLAYGKSKGMIVNTRNAFTRKGKTYYSYESGLGNHFFVVGFYKKGILNLLNKKSTIVSCGGVELDRKRFFEQVRAHLSYQDENGNDVKRTFVRCWDATKKDGVSRPRKRQNADVNAHLGPGALEGVNGTGPLVFGASSTTGGVRSQPPRWTLKSLIAALAVLSDNDTSEAVIESNLRGICMFFAQNKHTSLYDLHKLRNEFRTLYKASIVNKLVDFFDPQGKRTFKINEEFDHEQVDKTLRFIAGNLDKDVMKKIKKMVSNDHGLKIYSDKNPPTVFLNELSRTIGYSVEMQDRVLGVNTSDKEKYAFVCTLHEIYSFLVLGNKNTEILAFDKDVIKMLFDRVKQLAINGKIIKEPTAKSLLTHLRSYAPLFGHEAVLEDITVALPVTITEHNPKKRKAVQTSAAASSSGMIGVNPQINGFERELVALREQVELQKAEIASLEAKVSELNTELDKEAGARNTNVDLVKEINGKNSKIRQLSDDNARLLQEKQVLQDQLRIATEAAVVDAETVNVVSQLKEAYARVSSDLATKDKQLRENGTRYEHNLCQATVQITELQSKLEASLALVASKDTEITQMQCTVGPLRERTRQVEAENHKLSGHVKSLEEAVEASSKTSEAEKARLNSEIHLLKCENEGLRVTIRGHEVNFEDAQFELNLMERRNLLTEDEPNQNEPVDQGEYVSRVDEPFAGPVAGPFAEPVSEQAPLPIDGLPMDDSHADETMLVSLTERSPRKTIARQPKTHPVSGSVSYQTRSGRLANKPPKV